MSIFLTAGEHPHSLYPVVAAKEHTPQEPPHISHVLFFGVLGQPLYDRTVIVKFRAWKRSSWTISSPPAGNTLISTSSLTARSGTKC